MPGKNRTEVTIVDIVLKRPGASEIVAVKALVDVAGYSIAEAKRLIDAGPVPILGAVPIAVARIKAAALRDAGVHVELVPSADIHAVPRLDGLYISPVVETIRAGLIWRRKHYRRLALQFRGDGSCEEHSLEFRKETLPSMAIRILGSIVSHPTPDEIKDLGDGQIEKDGVTWTFVPAVRSVSG